MCNSLVPSIYVLSVTLYLTKPIFCLFGPDGINNSNVMLK